MFGFVQDCAQVRAATIVTTASGFEGGPLLAYGVARGVDLRAALNGGIDVPATAPPLLASATFTSIPVEVSSIWLVHLVHERDVELEFQSEPVAPGVVATVGVPLAPLADRASLITQFTASAALGPVVHLRRSDRVPGPSSAAADAGPI